MLNLSMSSNYSQENENAYEQNFDQNSDNSNNLEQLDFHPESFHDQLKKQKKR